MKFIREIMSREITEVFIPKLIEVESNGLKIDLEKTTVRIAKLHKIIQGGKIFQKSIVEYQFETYKGKESQWNKMDKDTYDKIVKMSKGWMPDYRGSFKVSQKIIGITFK